MFLAKGLEKRVTWGKNFYKMVSDPESMHEGPKQEYIFIIMCKDVC